MAKVPLAYAMDAYLRVLVRFLLRAGTRLSRVCTPRLGKRACSCMHEAAERERERERQLLL